eukprot:3018488-Amphidinium_carterae.1
MACRSVQHQQGSSLALLQEKGSMTEGCTSSTISYGLKIYWKTLIRVEEHVLLQALAHVLVTRRALARSADTRQAHTLARSRQRSRRVLLLQH